MNGNGYFQILAEYLIPFARKVYGENAIHRQDNATTHTSINCRNLLRSAKINWIRVFLALLFNNLK